jgi:hypothetical protein
LGGGPPLYLLLIQHVPFFNIYTRLHTLFIPLDKPHKSPNIHTNINPPEFLMATKPSFLFKGKESKKEEKAEKKAFPTKAGYAKAEKKYEKEMPKKGMKK